MAATQNRQEVKPLLVPAQPASLLKILVTAQMRASFYKGYAARLASWGFIVLQYDVPFLTTLPDTPEVRRAASCSVVVFLSRDPLHELCLNKRNIQYEEIAPSRHNAMHGPMHEFVWIANFWLLDLANPVPAKPHQGFFFGARDACDQLFPGNRRGSSRTFISRSRYLALTPTSFASSACPATIILIMRDIHNSSTTKALSVQLEWLDQILDWAGQQSRTADSNLHRLFDLDHVGCVGHSRGGKLAALQFAGAHCVACLYAMEKAFMPITDAFILFMPFMPWRKHLAHAENMPGDAS